MPEKARRYTLKHVTTPVTPPHAPRNAPAGTAAAPSDARGAADASRDPFIRPENEDDDGYDPFSDRQERVPFFEEDPWR